MTRDIPFFKQDTVYTCGPASLQMALSALGRFRSEAHLAKRARASKKNGTTHRHMIEAVRSEGLYCYVNENSSVDEIRRFVGAGLPVIVDFIEPSDNEPHYALVVGFYSGGIVLNDPWNGEGFVMKEHNFLDRWKDASTRSMRWMMVVSREDFELGRQYKPKGNGQSRERKF